MPQKKPLMVIYTRSKGRNYLISLKFSSTKLKIQMRRYCQLHSKIVCSRSNVGWMKNLRGIKIIKKEKMDIRLRHLNSMKMPSHVEDKPNKKPDCMSYTKIKLRMRTILFPPLPAPTTSYNEKKFNGLLKLCLASCGLSPQF